jgi:hypothetical protein
MPHRGSLAGFLAAQRRLTPHHRTATVLEAQASTRGHRTRHDPLVRPQIPSVRLTLRSLIYVVAVALIAAVGFTEESPWPIVLAALLALPASIVALPGYYVLYGVLALIPGANPSSNTGTETIAPDGSTLTSVTTGSPAAWFTITTHVLGILALTVAAFLNVLLLRALAARRQGKAPSDDSGLDAR